jgi:protein SCO1/2
MMRGVIGPSLLVTAVLSLCLVHAMPATGQGFSPQFLEEIGIDQRLDEQAPLDLEFRDEQGNAVRLGDYFGDKPVVLALVYYECPMLCTEVLNGLTRALRALSFDVGKEFDIVTVSFDPEETPVLARTKKNIYIEEYDRQGASEGWHFLTGDEDSIRALTESVGFRYVYVPSRDQHAHASGIIVLTPKGKISRYFYGIEYSTRDLRLGLVEAAADKIGTAVDQILLLCYHYDPTTGKYGMVIMNVIRIAGLATVLGLAGFMVPGFLRDRRKSRLARETP